MAGERLVSNSWRAEESECTSFDFRRRIEPLRVPQFAVDPSRSGRAVAAVLESGADIRTLNQLRAASSRIAGARYSPCPDLALDRSLIMVDNVVSGERWVRRA